MTQAKAVYVIAAKRTPVGKAGGVFGGVRPDDLLSHVMKAALAEVPQCDPSRIGDVIIGCAMPEAEQGMNVARMSALLAGLPASVAGMTINRFCASGLQAIATAADKIRLGEADFMMAGGVESMSMIPMGGHYHVPNPKMFDKDHLGMAYGMGVTAELVAREYEITRQAQDEMALSSHERALHAQAASWFDAEIAPFTVERKVPNLSSHSIIKHAKAIKVDEGPRKDSSIEALARLRCVFDVKGTVTAGNTSQMSDGAAVLLLASEQMVAQLDVVPLARFVGYEVAGVAPEVMGIGPTVAIPKLLDRVGIQLDDIDWIELNEAFAAQALACMKTLSLDPAKVNPMGGAIALGHPLGATGAIRACTILHGMRRQHHRYGVVSMCIGTGMGAAGLFESV